MDRRSHVYTELAECQDCYKCLRACPVKAIQVVEGHAQVRPEACIACGRCVAACPPHAKRVRDDLDAVRGIVAGPGPVAVSLAPSWVAEFPDLAPGQMVAALRRLGFAIVSETALGARAVSAAVAEARRTQPDRLLLSTACPAALDWVRKHRPQFVPALTSLASPALAHARMLLGAGAVRVVLVSPCIAKKREAEDHPELLAAAITFADLRRWLDAAAVAPAALVAGDDDRFALGEAGEGILYPVEGGMLTGIRAVGRATDAGLASASGITDLDLALAGLDLDHAGLFVEMLACAGGCVNGPGMTTKDGLLRRRTRVEGYAKPAQAPPPAIDTGMPWPPLPATDPQPGAAALTAALARVGKRTKADELNCSGCGYESCRDFAAALCAGRAETAMCATYMRRLAQRKANALLTAMPAGALLVDEHLAIIEGNRHAARLLGCEPRFTENGLAGVPLAEVAPFVRVFQHVLGGGGDVLDKDFRCGNRVLHGSVFSVEAGRVVGAVLVDATAPAMSRAQVATRTKEAISKHLAAVQQIAFLLGENAAETETLLGSIVESHENPLP